MKLTLDMATSFQYPAGEWQVRLPKDLIGKIEVAGTIEFRSRPGFKVPLMQLALFNDAVRGINPVAKRILSMPYLPYGRADRRFVQGDCHGLAAFGGLLNAMEFHEVRTLDVHHHGRAHMWIKNLVNYSPAGMLNELKNNYDTILFPDEGAARRYTIKHKHITYAGKMRDGETGKILEFLVPPLTMRQTILIVDDICDGGATFIGIADKLIALNPRHTLDLYVTHGIFSKGMDDLKKRFRQIYCTDSMRVNTVVCGPKVQWDAHEYMEFNPEYREVWEG